MSNKFPKLNSISKPEKFIGLDIETYDPHLKELGPSVRTGGFIVGIAISIDGKKSYYLPIRHATGFNYPIDEVRSFLNELLSTRIPKVGANLIYDLDYLTYAGFRVSPPYYDIQLAEPLLNENRQSYSLNALAKHYLDVTKYEDELDQWAKENLPKRSDPKSNIHKMPSELVAEYALIDAELPVRIIELQIELLKHQDLYDLFILESELLELLLAMKQIGVRINTEKADELEERFNERKKSDQEKLFKLAGFDVNVSAASSIAKACDKLGISYTRTAKTGQPSFTKQWMMNHNNEFFNLILDVRKWEKMNGTFIQGSILKYLIEDRIHCQFNQLKNNDYGTVSGRFSSSNPNLQFIPARDPELGPLVRGLFIPEEDCHWVKFDYSSIEPRISLHYADGMDHIKEKLIEDPGLDVYQPMMDLLPELDRKVIKTIYLGISYAMGSKRLASQLNMPIDQAYKIINTFNRSLPYLSQLSKEAAYMAKNRGYVKTIMNRRRRFKRVPGEHDFSYKAFNSVIQGGSADIMKKAMVDLWRSGIFREVPIPHLTVHDELDFSIPKGKEKYIDEIKHIMENAFELTVPLHVSAEIGPNWGSLEVL